MRNVLKWKLCPVILACMLSLFFCFASFAIGPFLDQEGSVVKPLLSDDTAGLNGGMIRFLRNEANDQQQLSALVRSSDGGVIVIDGGAANDSAHLLRVIKENGGRVDAWLITHCHDDHVGALTDILANHRGEVDIRGIYYCFPEYQWFHQVEPERTGALDALSAQLASLPEDMRHGTLSRGQVIYVTEKLSARVLNAPVKSYDSFAVNSSSVMYDITVDGKHLVILGDMGQTVGSNLLKSGTFDGISCDYVQMAHHGQGGVGEEVYRRLAPKNCIWNTPAWLYYAEPGNPNCYLTWQTKGWMTGICTGKNYCTAAGDVLIR